MVWILLEILIEKKKQNKNNQKIKGGGGEIFQGWS